MSDEQEKRHGAAGRPPAGDDDATRISQNHPQGDPRSGDATTPMPTADATPPMPAAADPAAADPTTRVPRTPDATSIMPPAGRDPNWGSSEAAWSGRAEVRPRRQGAYEETDWSTERPAEPRGRWWMPILVGIIALVLLAALGWGIWLIAQAQDDQKPGPVTPTTVAPAPTTARPTTAAATSEPPTAEPTTAEPPTAEVTIPAVRGMTQDDARQALFRSGLAARLRLVPSTDAEPGIVIGSDPQEGRAVPPGTVVTLIIAAEPTAAPTVTATTTQPDDD